MHSTRRKLIIRASSVSEFHRSKRERERPRRPPASEPSSRAYPPVTSLRASIRIDSLSEAAGRCLEIQNESANGARLPRFARARAKFGRSLKSVTVYKKRGKREGQREREEGAARRIALVAHEGGGGRDSRIQSSSEKAITHNGGNKIPLVNPLSSPQRAEPRRSFPRPVSPRHPSPFSTPVCARDLSRRATNPNSIYHGPVHY